MKLSLPISALLAAASPVFAAIDVYLAYGDGVQGVANTGSIFTGGYASAVIYNIQGQPIKQKLIELNSYSLGFSQSINVASQSTGTGAGKLQFSQLTITKPMDVNTPLFFQRIATGKQGSAMLYLVKSVGTGAGVKPTAFFTMEFRDVAISSQSFGQSSNDSDSGDYLLETLNFQYGATQIIAADQNAQGNLVNPQQAQWNRISNSNTVNVNNQGTG